MTPDTGRPESDPVYVLLPWYANGTLSAADQHNVEQALAADPEVRGSLQRIEEERRESIALNEIVPGPAGGFDRLMARIETEAPRTARSRSPGLLPRLLAGIGRLSPSAIAYAGAALALVVIAQGGALISLLSTPHGEDLHQIAATPSPPGASGETTIVVQFAPGVMLDAVTTLLRSERASISSGPDASGLFRLVVPAGRADAVIADLAAHKSLVLVARAAD